MIIIITCVHEERQSKRARERDRETKAHLSSTVSQIYKVYAYTFIISINMSHAFLEY